MASSDTENNLSHTASVTWLLRNLLAERSLPHSVRQRAEETLAAAEEEYRKLLERQQYSDRIDVYKALKDGEKR